MFYDTIEFTHFTGGETYRIKIAPKMYADISGHEFNGNYALYVNDRETEITTKNNEFKANGKLPDGLLAVVKQKILDKIKADNGK